MTTLHHSAREAQPSAASRAVRDARRRMGLTTTALAAALHVDKSLVSRWESGQRLFSGPLAARCCDRLGLPHSLLYAVDDRARMPVPGLSAVRSRHGVSLPVLARHVGVHRETIRSWESQESAPRMHQVRLLCAALDLQHSQPLRIPPGPPPRSHPLRAVRDRAGLTQADAARRLRIGRPRLARYEQGQERPTYVIARRMADAYGCQLTALARAAGLPPPVLLIRRVGIPGTWPDVLRQLRDWHGVSVPELARLADVRPQTVRSWERGLTRPSRAKCQRLERTFNLAPDALHTS